MADHDMNISVPRGHLRSYQDVLKALSDQGIPVTQEMPEIGVIRVKVDDPSRLDAIRGDGLPVEEGRRDVGMAPTPSREPPNAPEPSPSRGRSPSQAPAPVARSPLSDL